MPALQKYTKEWLENLCQESFSLAEVLQKAGRKSGGGNQATLKKKIAEFQIDTSHFTGQGWSKGKTRETDSRINFKDKYEFEEIFTEDSIIKRTVVRRYILRHNLFEYKCAFCGNDGHWLEQEIALDLDHINGISNDHRLVNLRFLCPNCHATTETYRGKNKTK